MKRPNFFLIGAPKSGTTALASYLAQHPEVFFSIPKEPSFFCTDLTFGPRGSLRDYETLFASATEHHLAVGEGSVLYLYSATAAKNIVEYNETSRCIVMLRNPVEMVHSYHSQMLYNGAEDKLKLRDAWALQEERKAGHLLPLGCPEPKLLYYGDVCRTGAQLERLYSMVPREQVHVVLYDDFRRSPALSYEKVLRFLGLRSGGPRNFPVINQSKVLRSRRLRACLGGLGTLKRRLGLRVTTGLLAPLHRFNGRPTVREPLPEDLRIELREYFRSDIQLLSGLLSRDLSKWLDGE